MGVGVGVGVRVKVGVGVGVKVGVGDGVAVKVGVGFRMEISLSPLSEGRRVAIHAVTKRGKSRIEASFFKVRLSR